jgi:hypothetical protein
MNLQINKMRLTALCFVLALAGCAAKSTDQTKITPVSGVVALDGKPVAGATISFIPTGSTPGVGARGRTDGAGKYELETRFGGRGAPAGEYQVVVSKLTMPDGSDFAGDSTIAPIDSPAKQVLPAKYSARETTVLKAKVGDSDTVLDFSLSTRP